ncbi:hypothetical protein D6C78_07613 [Aureobasidium pullulans]|uniref:Uncharacterized protein n=1 Tax=Aureobasidium pullulans TaxID=5580 RepID=A0A4V4LE06_AURPU|nr:hypothetical protein D6C78_07613 [Aureobasidium pullulans]
MTIKFHQAPLFYLDELKPSMFKRLHQAFLASPWLDSGPLPAMITRRLEQWEHYGDFYKAQRHLFEAKIGFRLLEDIMSNVSDSVPTVNIEYEEATDFAPITYGDDLRDLFAVINATDTAKFPQSAHLCEMVLEAGRVVGLVRID